MNNFRIFWRILVVCSLLLLAGCGSTSSTRDVAAHKAPSLMADPVYSGNHYLTKAELANASDQFAWELIAAKAFFNDGQPQPGQAILAKLQQELVTTQQHAAWQLTQAYGYIQQEQFEQALAALSFDSSWILSNDYWIKYYRLRSSLNSIQHNPVSAAVAYIRLENYLNNTVESEVTNQQIWTILQSISSQELRTTQRPDSPIINGWFELAAIANEPVKRMGTFRQQLQIWQEHYPYHPANSLIEEEVAHKIANTPFMPERIAIILPLSGKYQTSGNGLRDGIVAAQVDSESTNKPELVFFDSNRQTIEEIAASLQQDSFDCVLGPLLKENLAALRQFEIQQTWLSLNESLPQPTLPVDQFSFALTPEHEAMQAAEFISQQGLRSPQILAANTSIGQRMAVAFKTHWQQLHATQADIYYYGDRSDIQGAVKQLLQTDISQQRITQIKQLLGSDIETERRSRRDTQAIYLIANNIEAKLIRPFIDVSVNPYAKPIQLFTSSRAHSPEQNNSELDGLIVSEMPWILDSHSSNKVRFNQLWPKANSTKKRLYAMGYDSYNLIPQLNMNRGSSDQQLDGLTGKLSITDEGEIVRQLIWSQYQNGQLKPLQQPSEESSTIEPGLTSNRTENETTDL